MHSDFVKIPAILDIRDLSGENTRRSARSWSKSHDPMIALPRKRLFNSYPL